MNPNLDLLNRGGGGGVGLCGPRDMSIPIWCFWAPGFMLFKVLWCYGVMVLRVLGFRVTVWPNGKGYTSSRGRSTAIHV